MYLPYQSFKNPLNFILKWIDIFCELNEEHFAFHLQDEHSGTFANRKYEELSHNKNPKMNNPILVTLLKMSIQSWKCDPIQWHIPISLL